jgi:hypothetical protein
VRKILIVFAILYTVFLSLNFILGIAKTPTGYVFLGTVHHPNDYFYYLSLFTQGEKYWVSPRDLFTSEITQSTLIGFTNVTAGHILSYFNIPAIPAYQLTVTGYTCVFFLLVIFFLELVFPKEREAQCVAFILFGIANIVPGTDSFWANVTEPLVRFPRVPHQMLGLICILLPVIIVLKWQKQSHSGPIRYIFALGTIAASVLLANVNPIQWLLVFCTLCTVAIWQRAELRKIIEKRHGQYILLLLFLISGLPMVLYIPHEFSGLPFMQFIAWENAVHIRLSFINAIESFGPILIFAVVGLPLFCKRMTAARVFILVYTFASFVLFLSPISTYAHFTNIRFLSAVSILGECILAAYCFVHIPIANQSLRRILTWIIVASLIVFLTPQLYGQFTQRAYLDVSNSSVFLSADAVSAYREAQRRMNDEDVVLVTWPFDVSFTALTGGRGFMGHPLLTINADKKNQEASLFFNAQIDDAAMHAFLIDNHITYVLGLTANTNIVKPFLLAVYRNSLLTLYKVLPY